MTTTVEALLRRERWIIVGGLAVICLLSWLYIAAGAGTGMSTAAMTSWQFPPPALMPSMENTWGWSYWVIMLLMWWVMMIAMMVPSAAPMILLYARVQGNVAERGGRSSAIAPTAVFTAGYLAAWLGFSVAATSAQWLLEQAGLVHTMLMWSTSSTLSGVFLIAAGVYQMTPLKNVCLKHCRSPLHFLMHNMRKGVSGAFYMGIEHGAYCVGCCWVLMVLLFVGGTMNLVWIAGLAVFVLVEKIAPQGIWFGRVSGLVMIAAGVYLLA